MWAILIFIMIAITASGIFYLSSRLLKFEAVKKQIKNRKIAFMISSGFLLALFIIFAFLFGFMNSLVIFLHLVLVWLLCDGIFGIIRKIRKKEFKRYISGITAICFTAVWLLTGFFIAHRVLRTEYNLKTDKKLPVENLKIVGFSDSHIGTNFDGNGLKKYIDSINSEKPDIVVIVGDFVDDRTSLSDMKDACKALSGIKSAYGTYYVFGNHDAGYYSEEKRGYGKTGLTEELEKNGVTVLTDQTAEAAEGISVIGRLDKQDKTREKISDLIKDKSSYNIVIDHEPNDYLAEAAADADLVISGHTHGGQLIPVNRIGEWLGINDATYGHKHTNNTDFIVSSGIPKHLNPNQILE